MNIQQVKQEVKNTIRMYLAKNELGEYLVSRERQRPVFVIGAPGVGKTAIMKQIAGELGIGLLSYTITHHTRQSAIGLPFITKKTFQGKEFSLTEYTLSEIIASVYETIEKQDKQEGILFIDEINSVSETLAPAMLDLLQNKKFGPHHIPKGWVLVSAGNPVEFNKSVKEFDAVTLDRVKKINVDPDLEVWKQYAYKMGFNPTIIYYLTVFPSKLFEMETTPEGLEFCTPRSWEDLSVAMNMYAALNLEVTLDLMIQYIQKQDTAKDFYRYFVLYQKYQHDYDVDLILQGKPSAKTKQLKTAKFDERLSVVEILVSALNTRTMTINENNQIKKILAPTLKLLKKADGSSRKVIFKKAISDAKNFLDHFATSDFDKKVFAQVANILDKTQQDGEIEQHMDSLNQKGKQEAKELLSAIDHTFAFIKTTFGEGQEMIALMINLLASYHFVLFITYFPSQTFLEYNGKLLIDKKNKQLMLEIKAVEDQMDELKLN
jgi:hypothetical protein